MKFPMTMEIEMIGVCSAKPRPSVHNNNSKGHQYWKRDVYHLRAIGSKTRTRCGRDCSEWLVMGQLDEVTDNCCTQCLSTTAKQD